MDKDFLTSYYRDEMRAKGIDADYDVRLGDNYDKRNPTYYNSESAVNKFLGYGSRNDVSKSEMKPTDEWNNDFKLWVIGSDYCHSRMFQTDQKLMSGLKVSRLHKKMLLKLINKCLIM